MLMVSHSRLEAAEESMRNDPPKGGLLFASRQRDARQNGVTAAAMGVDSSADKAAAGLGLTPQAKRLR